jgi:hypothetical protein
MRAFLPEKFGQREVLWSLLAGGMAAVAGKLCWAAGMGGGGAWVLFTVVGTLLLVARTGRDRCFFTLLFNGLLWTGLVTSFVYDVSVRHEEFTAEFMLVNGMSFVLLVALPVGFAWLVSKVLKSK